MWSRHCSIVGIVLLAWIGVSVDGLYCFKCLNIDCSSKDLECQQIRTFIEAELKIFYYFKSSSDLAPCPQLAQTHKWKIMQIGHQHSYETCPEAIAKEATCTVGRMQIKTARTNPAGEPTVQLNFATIMGCAKRDLLRRINKPNVCDHAFINKTSDGVMRELQIEHCSDIGRLCYQNDYCVNYTQSSVKRWEKSEEAGNIFSLKLGIFGVVIIVIFASLSLGYLVQRRIGSSDIPPEGKQDAPMMEDDSKGVKVYHVSRANDKTTLIEVDQGNSNRTDETIARRDSSPPIPPPMEMDRGSTPV